MYSTYVDFVCHTLFSSNTYSHGILGCAERVYANLWSLVFEEIAQVRPRSLGADSPGAHSQDVRGVAHSRAERLGGGCRAREGKEAGQPKDEGGRTTVAAARGTGDAAAVVACVAAVVCAAKLDLEMGFVLFIRANGSFSDVEATVAREEASQGERNEHGADLIYVLEGLKAPIVFNLRWIERTARDPI